MEGEAPQKRSREMTRLLEEAFQKANELPEPLQDELARRMLQELAWEEQWDSTLEASQNQLDGLAAKALEDLEAGRTLEMGFDEL
jgi:hypothetical protein